MLNSIQHILFSIHLKVTSFRVSFAVGYTSNEFVPSTFCYAENLECNDFVPFRTVNYRHGLTVLHLNPGRHCMLSYLFQFYVVWILRLINFTIELTDFMMLLYLQGVTLNILFVQSLIPKLII